MLEKWKNAVNKEKCFGVLLMDFSKAFDFLSYGLLIVKLHVYGFDLPALKIIHSYVSSRKQRIKNNATHSSWEETRIYLFGVKLFGVLQGYILGPLLFNIFLCDLFWIMCETDFPS